MWIWTPSLGIQPQDSSATLDKLNVVVDRNVNSLFSDVFLGVAVGQKMYYALYDTYNP